MRHHARKWGPLIFMILSGTLPLTAVGGFRAEPHTPPNPGPGVANHPVGIKPTSKVKIPSEWPLAADGTLTCLTCHSTPPVGSDAGRNLRGAAGSTAGRAFCINCHGESGAGADMHWLALAKAHITAQDNRSNAALLRDGGSRSCLACHDGVTADDSGHNMGGVIGIGDASGTHPVGVRYPFGGKRRTEVPLRPASAVPPAVSLAGGVVSCTSCHNLYASDPQRLSVPIEGSKLCFACHDLN